MAISRSQMRRQLYNTGGITGIVHRQPYFLGGIGKILKKGAKAVKGIVSSDVGKMAITAALMGAPFMGGANPKWFGSGSAWGKAASMLPDWATGKVGKSVGAALLGGSLGTAFAGKTEEEVSEIARDKDALKAYLKQYYTNVNPELSAHPEQIDEWVESQITEYYSDGGRVGYAYGSDDKVMMASGITGIPINQNKAGVKELDMRDHGGFIPPVGVKEKADDIPAMVSNNEFVMTADAVKGMGGGDVNTGAQRMYQLMETLENGGRV